MNIRLRAGRPDDAESCGSICFEAFKAISDQHNFPRDFPNPKRPSDSFLNCCLAATSIRSWLKLMVEQSAVTSFGRMPLSPASGRSLLIRVCRIRLSEDG